MQTDDVKILKDIYKGSEMGIFALEEINPETGNKPFSQAIEKAKSQLEAFRDQVKYELIRHGEHPKELSRIQKLSAGAQISFSTMFDHSAENISETVIKGNEMGEEKMSEEIDKKKRVSKDTRDIALEFIDMQKKQKKAFSKYLN